MDGWMDVTGGLHLYPSGKSNFPREAQVENVYAETDAPLTTANLCEFVSVAFFFLFIPGKCAKRDKAMGKNKKGEGCKVIVAKKGQRGYFVPAIQSNCH